MIHRVLAVLALALLAACEEKSTPASSTPASKAASASSSAPAAAIDWSRIKAVELGSAVMSYKTLARHCDAWHKGKVPVITLRHDGAGTVSDGQGNTVSLPADCWKGIVAAVRAEPGKHIAVAAKSAMYDQSMPPIGPGWQPDTFGIVPRHQYQIAVIDDATITFTTQGMFDDGR